MYYILEQALKLGKLEILVTMSDQIGHPMVADNINGRLDKRIEISLFKLYNWQAVAILRFLLNKYN